MTNDEYEKIMKELRYNRQMKKKRLYEQAKRANKKKNCCIDKDDRRQ